MKRKPTYKMDERIGYGLTFDEALKLVSDTAHKLPDETVNHISVSTDKHGTIWAELRGDGWRVYIPRGSCQPPEEGP